MLVDIRLRTEDLEQEAWILVNLEKGLRWGKAKNDQGEFVNVVTFVDIDNSLRMIRDNDGFIYEQIVLRANEGVGIPLVVVETDNESGATLQ